MHLPRQVFSGPDTSKVRRKRARNWELAPEMPLREVAEMAAPHGGSDVVILRLRLGAGDRRQGDDANHQNEEGFFEIHFNVRSSFRYVCLPDARAFRIRGVLNHRDYDCVHGRFPQWNRGTELSRTND